MMSYLFVILGLIGLFFGGEFLIRGALGAARRLGVSPLLAGLVIVGFGTSVPELAVSVDAVIHGQPGIAVGNVVGSNIANILLILGLSALLMPVQVHPQAIRRDGVTMIGATVLCMLVFLSGTLGRIEGMVLLAGLVAYLAWAYRGEVVNHDAGAGLHEAESQAVQAVPDSIAVTSIAIIGGLSIIIAGSRFLIIGAVDIAQDFGVSETVIGLTLVAVGTSTPELAVSLLAAIRKQADVAIGNILGSNIFNIMAILGVSSLVKPLPVAERILSFDQWAMLIAAVALMVFAHTRNRLSRLEGGVLLAGYVTYVWLTFAYIT